MKIRISASVINFKKRALSTWKLKEWDGVDDPDRDVLFFGLFNDRDFATFDGFKGNKSVFWCGSDILLAKQDYERKRILKNNPAKHYCENEVEQENLKLVGVEAEIIPSFLDNIDNFPISFKPSTKPHIFICGHDQREDEYGAGIVKRIAKRIPEATFHIYGIDKDSIYFGTTELNHDKLINVDVDCPNVWYHGQVPEGQFNNEIMNYHCGLRTNEHDGMSEVTAKSILMGQYPITKIPYEGIWSYKTEDELVALIDKLRFVQKPNYEGRSLYLKKLNQFPWCSRDFAK